MKTCKGSCARTLPESEFWQKDGKPQARCKDCHRAAALASYRKHAKRPAPESMSGERFVRVCPRHRRELLEQGEGFWCPQGHNLEPYDSSGRPRHPFWCWDHGTGQRYAVVRGDRVTIDQPGMLDPTPKMGDRNGDGLTSAVAPDVEPEPDPEIDDDVAAARAKRARYNERLRAKRDGRPVASWARLKVEQDAQERKSA